jgi:hypothetical protein
VGHRWLRGVNARVRGPDDPRLAWYVLELTYPAREDVYAFGDGLLVDGRVAEDEAAGTGWLIR